MRRLALTLLAAALLSACSDAPLDGPHALFTADPASLDNPFPDARLLGEGGMEMSKRPKYYEPFLPRKAITRDSIEFFQGYAKSYETLKGFGNYGGVLVRFTDDVDGPDALASTAEGKQHFVYVEKNADGLWVKGPAARVTVPADQVLKDEKKFFAIVSPAIPLRPGSEAVLGLLSGAKTADGRALVRSPDFHQWAQKDGAIPVAAIAALHGVQSSDVVFAMELRPTRATDDLLSIRDWAQGPGSVDISVPKTTTDPLPAGVFDAGSDNLADVFKRWLGPAVVKGVAHVGEVVVGRFGSRDFRKDGVFDPSYVTAPDSAPAVMLDFVLTLPKGPKPPGGWPVIIGAHGINGRNSLSNSSTDSFCMKLAELFATSGFGCIGIDAASHGNRGNIFEFFSVRDVLKTRDNFRQTAADQLQLLRVIRQLDLDHDGTPDLSPVAHYFGNSMGSIMGATFIALQSPDYPAHVHDAVLNVPGAALTSILTQGDQKDAVGLLLSAETGIDYLTPEYEAAFPFFRAAAQTLVDPGDPILYADMLGGRRVLVQEGVEDRTIPNASTEALISVAALEPVTATSSDAAGLSGYFAVRSFASQESPNYGIGDTTFNPHEVFWRIPQVREQAMRYFTSGGTEILVSYP